MTVLHVVHGSPHTGQIGGTELYVDALARATGAAVAIPGDAAHLDAPYPLIRGALRDAVRTIQPDVLHIHHLAGHGLDVPRLPTVVTLHDYHLACLRGQLVDHDGAVCTGPTMRKCRACVGWSPPALMARGVWARHLARRARLLSPSAHLAAEMTRLGFGPVHVLDLPLVGPVDAAPDAPPGRLRLLFAGSVIPTKGPHILARAVEGLDVELTLYGPGTGDYADRLRRELPENAAWRGVFEAARRSEIYAEHDVLVVPSTWAENSPLVVREAVAAGLRVVCSDVGGIAEIDPDAVRVPAGDVHALRQALEAEARRGRGRRPARSFPMNPHLAALDVHYAACS